MKIDECCVFKKQNIYLIVRSLKASDGKSQRGYNLNPGDVIKLGRIEYRVVEIQPGLKDSVVRKVESSYEHNSMYDAINQQIGENTEKICRYCLMEEDTIDKPNIESVLLYPCQCSESAGGAHFSCLKNYIRDKIVSQVNNTTTYQWKKLECEVCKVPFPRKIKYSDGEHELITVQKLNSPYIILEEISD